MFELLERDLAEDRPRGGDWVDREHIVTRGLERTRELTPTAADLEHPGRHLRKLGKHPFVEAIHRERQS